MSSYNYKKAADRNRRRQEIKSALEAIENKTWPRNLNESLEFTGKYRGKFTEIEWAEKIYRFELKYLQDVEVRLCQNDPALIGWER